MEGWLTTVISLVGSTIVTTVIAFVVKHYIKKYIDKKDADKAELETLREARIRASRKQDVEDAIGIVVKPLEDKIDDINNKLEKVENGTLSTLRNDILTCYYRCVDKGYRNDYDYQNMHHMYDSYSDLNGNSYVADVIKRFDDLLTKEEFLARQAKNKVKTKKTGKVSKSKKSKTEKED